MGDFSHLNVTYYWIFNTFLLVCRKMITYVDVQFSQSFVFGTTLTLPMWNSKLLNFGRFCKILVIMLILILCLGATITLHPVWTSWLFNVCWANLPSHRLHYSSWQHRYSSLQYIVYTTQLLVYTVYTVHSIEVFYCLVRYSCFLKFSNRTAKQNLEQWTFSALPNWSFNWLSFWQPWFII